VYELLKMNDEAEKSAREALSRDQENVDPYAKLVALYLRQAQSEKAKTTFADVLQKFPNMDGTFSKVDSEIIHRDDDVAPEILQEFEKLLLSFPNELGKSQNGLRALSEAQRMQKKYDLSIKTLQRVITLSSSSEDQVTIAEIYREMKKFPLALIASEKAIKMDEENSVAYFERACALARLARKREALTALKKALELDPEISYLLSYEEDLKPLATMPEFKKLVPKEDEEDQLAQPVQVKTAKP
jgi:tetratricopeptide (TPR) repeat protein